MNKDQDINEKDQDLADPPESYFILIRSHPSGMDILCFSYFLFRKQDSPLPICAAQLQKRDSSLQIRATQLQKMSSPLQIWDTQLQKKGSLLQIQDTQLQIRRPGRLKNHFQPTCILQDTHFVIIMRSCQGSP